MKTVIFCGGKGTRMREETEFRPKPLVEIGGKPMLWHIMKLYSHYGFNDFILTLGYKGRMIKEYFMYERAFANDFTLNAASRALHFHSDNTDDFTITFAETGLESLTGERLISVLPYVGDEFMVTYGDGIGDIAIDKLLDFHRTQGTIATVTGVHPHSKWGLFQVNSHTGRATHFQEKPIMSDYVNGGFMVFNKHIFDHIDKGPIESSFARLASMGELSVYPHQGFWKAMDTYHERLEMNDVWGRDKPWAIWEK